MFNGCGNGISTTKRCLYALQVFLKDEARSLLSMHSLGRIEPDQIQSIRDYLERVVTEN